MFFLPLPHNKTTETLNDVTKSLPSDLPSPELYIIVNGQPTKSKVMWRSLVDVNVVKQAKQKLQQINWLYRELDDDVVDKAVKNVVEVAQNSSNAMLEKVSDSDVAAFQSYTIRNLNRKAPTESDIEQFKLVNVREKLIDNRLKFLDVMCFPVLFPNGQFGKYHDREVSLSHSEYVKSRLYNRDSRFRKDSQYIFYLLHEKEMREIATGVCNLLKRTKSRPMSVDQLLSKVQSSDEHLESNLSTILQQVRGGAGRRYFILDGFKERLILNLTTSSDLVLVSQNIVIEHHTEEGVNEDVEEFSAGCLHRGEVQRQDGGVIGWGCCSITLCGLGAAPW